MSPIGIMCLFKWIQFCIIFLLATDFSDANVCSTFCTCSREDTIVTCNNASLTRVPNLPSTAVTVDFENNDISILRNYTLHTSPRIELVNLENNGIIHIEAGSFVSLPDLEILRLGKNHISHLPRDIFQANRKLEVLDLHSNSFTEIPDYVMLSLHNLQILNMSYNSLATPMLGQGFKGTKKITTIDLTGNNLVALESHVFQATLWLDDKVTHYLNLSYCNIQHIFPNTLNQLYHIDFLSLDGNDAIPPEQLQLALDDLSISSLEMLSLSKMNITDIHPYFNKSQHRNLVKLILSHNKIRHIRDRTFYYLVKLRLLDISHNYLKTLNNLDGLSNLQYLYLSHNELTSISETLLEELTLLKVLDLSHNLLVNIDDTPFQTLFDLQSLYLGSNDLTSFAITTGFENLETLSLQSNRLQSMLSVGMLMKLKNLDLSDNEIAFLGPSTFSQGQSLKAVNLSHNSISVIDGNAFSDSIVDVLDISYNKLISLHYFGLQQVKRLYAQANVVRNISVDAFFRQNTLLELNIEQNQISWLPRYLFTPVYSLRAISLNSNPLGNYLERTEESHVIFGSLRKLEKLKLANVSVKLIPAALFDSLTSLKSLDMSRNQILDITPEIFHNTTNLTFLNVSCNSIKSPDINTLQHLRHLETIDMSHNPFHCTCDLIPFRRWLIDTNVTVLGPIACEGPREWAGTSVRNFHLDSSACSSHTKLIIFIAAGCTLLLLLTCILFSIIYKCGKRKKRKLNKLDYSSIRYADKEAHIQYNPQSDMEMRSKKEWM